MQTAAQSWTPQLLDELDRYVAMFFVRDATRYRCVINSRPMSDEDLAQIRVEVLANATTDRTSLAYQMLMESGPSGHGSDPCPTCDATIRLAWGASATRRTLGLPASNDLM
jgi:hypothetical protein